MSRNRLKNRAAGALARKARQAAGNTTSTPLQTKVTTTPSSGDTSFFSSRPTADFRNRLTTAIQQDTRAQLDIRIQGYILSPIAIFDDINDAKSPFKWPNSSGTGKIFKQSEIRTAARTISQKMYNHFKRAAISKGAIRVSGNPRQIVDAITAAANSKERIFFAYNDSDRIIYFWNPRIRDSFKSFTRFLSIERQRLIRNEPSNSPVVTYLQPDEEWLRLKEQISLQLKEEGASSRQASERFARERRLYSTSTGKAGYEGIEYGHTFGASATKAAAFLQNPEDLSHTYAGKSSLRIIGGFSSDTEETIVSSVDTLLVSDTRIKFEKRYSSQDVHGELTLFMNENALSNRVSGGQTTGPLRVLRNIVNRIDSAILQWAGSPSFNQLIVEIIENSFLGIKTTSKTFSTKTKITTKNKANIRISKPGGFKGRPEYSEPKEGKTTNTDLSQLIAFLNSRLHDKIRENMGKGGAKQILNYRTGRFAKSAKIQALYPIGEKRAIGAKVKYMRYPYGVFEPKGRLYKPGRDPHRIFGRSIRQLLQEEKIANLRRVKVQLDG